MKEMTTMAQLSHPNVVALLAVVTTAPMMLVLEYMNQGSLYNFVRSRKSPVVMDEVVRMARQIASGLA